MSSRARRMSIILPRSALWPRAISEGADNGNGKKWTPDLNRYFKDRDVYILPDNDAPGRQHAEHVARNLDPVAKSVRIVELPGLPHKGDVSNWLESDSAGVKLAKLAAAAPLGNRRLRPKRARGRAAIAPRARRHSMSASRPYRASTVTRVRRCLRTCRNFCRASSPTRPTLRRSRTYRARAPDGRLGEYAADCVPFTGTGEWQVPRPGGVGPARARSGARG